MHIAVKHKGDLGKTTEYLTRAQRLRFEDILGSYGEKGVALLSAATPRDTGLTASSWDYQVSVSRSGRYAVTFTNSYVVSGVPIALILQYGHGTRNGGYVQGRDYINPALKPVFDELAEALWKEVTGR